MVRNVFLASAVAAGMFSQIVHAQPTRALYAQEVSGSFDSTTEYTLPGQSQLSAAIKILMPMLHKLDPAPAVLVEAVVKHSDEIAHFMIEVFPKVISLAYKVANSNQNAFGLDSSETTDTGGTLNKSLLPFSEAKKSYEDFANFVASPAHETALDLSFQKQANELGSKIHGLKRSLVPLYDVIKKKISQLKEAPLSPEASSALSQLFANLEFFQAHTQFYSLESDRFIGDVFKSTLESYPELQPSLSSLLTGMQKLFDTGVSEKGLLDALNPFLESFSSWVKKVLDKPIEKMKMLSDKAVGTSKSSDL